MAKVTLAVGSHPVPLLSGQAGSQQSDPGGPATPPCVSCWDPSGTVTDHLGKSIYWSLTEEEKTGNPCDWDGVGKAPDKKATIFGYQCVASHVEWCREALHPTELLPG